MKAPSNLGPFRRGTRMNFRLRTIVIAVLSAPLVTAGSTKFVKDLVDEAGKQMRKAGMVRK
jgi:hypothetical protein